jgi:hypothetical protein
MLLYTGIFFCFKEEETAPLFIFFPRRWQKLLFWFLMVGWVAGWLRRLYNQSFAVRRLDFCCFWDWFYCLLDAACVALW